jgi:hypothetical protein
MSIKIVPSLWPRLSAKSSTPRARTRPISGSGRARMSHSIAPLPNADRLYFREPGASPAAKRQGDGLTEDAFDPYLNVDFDVEEPEPAAA